MELHINARPPGPSPLPLASAVQVAYAEFELDAVMLTGSCVDVTASGRMVGAAAFALALFRER